MQIIANALELILNLIRLQNLFKEMIDLLN